MVSSFEQAKAIQLRRVAAGKRGIAKAVRRFVKRTGWHHLARLPQIDPRASAGVL